MSSKPRNKQDIINNDYAKLIDVPIKLSDAAEKYNVPRKNIANWVKRGYISVITPGYGMTVNEAEVAYCVDVYKRKKTTGIGFRGPLLDKNGLPYKLKHPMLSRQRKKKKTGELPRAK